MGLTCPNYKRGSDNDSNDEILKIATTNLQFASNLLVGVVRQRQQLDHTSSPDCVQVWEWAFVQNAVGRDEVIGLVATTNTQSNTQGRQYKCQSLALALALAL